MWPSVRESGQYTYLAKIGFLTVLSVVVVYTTVLSQEDIYKMGKVNRPFIAKNTPSHVMDIHPYRENL